MALSTKLPSEEEMQKEHEQRMAENAAALADEERRQVMEHRELVARLTLEIDELLINNNATARVWMEIVDNFNKRYDVVIPNLKIKELKERYEQRS